MEHRRDIDGLRAVAVGTVVAYHLGALRLSGGFIGVDVFFVISGFLITGLISRELDGGSFTVTDFYRRRLRRIVPALLAMLVATCVVAAFLLFSSELHDLGASALWAAFFSSNFWFWRHSGYFDAPSANQPLLHTWSLAVEEQFYLFFPLLLVTVHRRRRQAIRLLILAITVASFVLAVALVREGTVGAAFYLLPCRAWELGAGALLATSPDLLPERLPASWQPPARHLASVVGVVLIVGDSFRLTGTSHFPGSAALAPVVGAVLLIWAGPRSVVGRFLSIRPVVFVGLVSYSWYLWHWPMIVLYRLYTFNALTPRSELLLAVTSFAVAVLSWRLVEQPLRRLSLTGRPRVVGFAVTSVVAASLLGLLVQPFSRAVHPVSANVSRLLASTSLTDGNYFRTGSCFISTGYTAADFSAGTCLPQPSQPEQKATLLLGDSHAADLYAGLHQLLPAVDLQQATASGCLPDLQPAGEKRCVTLIRRIYYDYLPHAHVDTVVLSAHWVASDVPHVAATIAYLRTVAKHVILVGPSPEYLAALPALLARAADTDDPGLPARHLDRSQVPLDAALAKVAATDGASFVSLIGELCVDHRCRQLVSPGVPLEVDTAHFSKPGSVIAAAGVASAVTEALH